MYKKYYAYISALVAIPDCEQLCACVCVCVCVCVHVWMFMLEILHRLHEAIFLVSRETALFRQAILRVLTKKHGCTPFTLCSHQTCGGIQNPRFRIQPHACDWMVKTHACGCIHCLMINSKINKIVNVKLGACRLVVHFCTGCQFSDQKLTVNYIRR